MRLLIPLCCVLLAGCTPPNVTPVVPGVLLQPVPVPSRPLNTYRDAVIRDAERGAALNEANQKLISIAKIVAPE